MGGTEAELIGDAAWTLTDDARTLDSLPDGLQLGIVLFDQMNSHQQIVQVDRVLALLLDETIPAPPRTALLDATIAALYAQIFARLECEIYSEQTSSAAEDDDTSHRQLVLQVLLQHDSDRNWPDPECTVTDTWRSAIESLQERVLGDQDFQMDGLTLDLPPERAQELKEVMGISGDYFIDVPPEVSREDAAISWANILERVSGTRPNLEVF